MVERIIEFSARNRVLVLVTVALALIGAVAAMKRIKLDAIPDLSEPQVIVFTEWMGRSPTLVEDQVTYPISARLIGTPKVKDVRGYSMFGMSFIYVVFDEGTDLYWARSRVLEYLNGLQGSLPESVRPTLGPDATGIGWVFQYVLEDKTGRHGLDELRTFQDFTLRYALGSVPGVAEVASIGGYQRQYQVTVDPAKLRAFGVTVGEVIAAIRQSNNDVGGRILEMSGREYYIRGRGYIQDLAAIENIALRASGQAGTPLRVRDVASVRFGPEIRRGLLEWNGEGEAVGAIVVMRYGENAREMIGRVQQKIEELRPSFPQGVELKIGYDRSDLIDRSIDTLKHALIEEALVVGLVIVLFLLHVRSSLLPIVSLPIAVSLSFIPMFLLDIPSTIMSLGGIAIAIGATVDAEIVMIEAAHKKLEHAPAGANRARLLAEAAREVTPAIFFSLLIVAVAFLPVFALTGQAGRLFRPLAYTKTFVMVISALLSITFAPALRDLLIRGRIYPERRHPVSRLIVRFYEPFVYVALRRPRSTIAIGALAVLSAIPIGLRLGHEFMPPLNEGDILYMPITFPNISIEEAKRQLQIQDRILRELPEVDSVFGKVGRAESATDPAPLSMVETTVRLKPVNEWRTVERPRWYSGWAPPWLAAPLRPIWPDRRRITWDELTAEMNDKLQLPGWTNAWTMPIKTRIDMLTTGVRTPVGIKVFGRDLAEIEKVGTTLEGLIAAVPGTRSVLYERNLGGLYIDIIPRPEALARYGLRIADVQEVIETAIGGTPIGVTVEGRNRFSINVRYPQDLRSSLDRLREVLVPLSSAGDSRGGSSDPAMPMGTQGALPVPMGSTGIMLAQAMPGMDGVSGGGMGAAPRASGSRARLPGPGAISDAPPVLGAGSAMGSGAPAGGGPGGGMSSRGGTTLMVPGMAPGAGASSAGASSGARAFVTLGQVADIRIASGPPMLRDEAGLLVGYVYVDIDAQSRDIGGYVDDAKATVADAIARGDLKLPQGTYLKWTGQYEQLEEMRGRMKIVIPLALAIVVLLLFFQFRNWIEVFIVLLSLPFALVGSVWLLYLLEYRLSTAVWVGIIALLGLAAQTGVVMIMYLDQAYLRRKRAGEIRTLADIVEAHMEGTVQRVRPKLMTVATMLMGLVPLLWADTSGADVMKRIAAPMVGGLVTSAFLTLELIPVIATFWRQEELLWESLAVRSEGAVLRRLRGATALIVVGALLAVAALASRPYVALSSTMLAGAFGAAVAVAFTGALLYARSRAAGRHLIWP